MAHRTYDQLAAKLDFLRAAPQAIGTLELVVTPPGPGRA